MRCPALIPTRFASLSSHPVRIEHAVSRVSEHARAVVARSRRRWFGCGLLRIRLGSRGLHRAPWCLVIIGGLAHVLVPYWPMIALRARSRSGPPGLCGVVVVVQRQSYRACQRRATVSGALAVRVSKIFFGQFRTLSLVRRDRQGRPVARGSGGKRVPAGWFYPVGTGLG